MHRWPIAAILFFTAACHTAGHPPAASDDDNASAGAANEDDSGIAINPDSTLPLSAQDLCGETVVELEPRRPNLYFLLDVSGSMTAPMPGTVIQNRFNAARSAIGGVLRKVGHRVRYGVSVFPSAEHNGCGAGEEIQTTEDGDSVSYALSGTDGPRLRGLMDKLAKVSPGGTTPTRAALAGVKDTLTALAGDTYLFLLTDGAPNCNPDATCDIANCIPNIEGAYYTQTAVCDATINCCSEAEFGPGAGAACLDGNATVAAVVDLANANIKTFVIGIPGTDTYANLLDTLAMVGGTARSQSPFYYRVTDGDELAATLLSLGEDLSYACTIALNDVPPDPSLVNVFIDDKLVYFNETSGWRWKDPGTVELVGETCDLVKGGQVLDIHVIAGCPAVVR